MKNRLRARPVPAALAAALAAALSAAALCAVALCAVALSAAAGPVETLFETPHLATLAPGESVRYARVTESDPALGLGPGGASAILLTRRPDGVALTLDADAAAPRPLPPFPGDGGNPLLMVFLETTLRAVAQATGGNPHYIRRRMMEGLGSRMIETAGPGGAREARLAPFATDAERARLGPFADLELRFSFDEATPGMIARLTAEARGPDGRLAYREEIRHDPSR